MALQGTATRADDWSARKCELYALAFADALAARGTEGLGRDFLAENDAFIKAGCPGEKRICAHDDAEIALANLLTVMTMNEGMASTFVPFGCAP